MKTPLLTVPLVAATVIACKRRIIFARADTGMLITVHTPGFTMAGVITSGLKIYASPYAEPKMCSHYLIAMETEGLLIGANPNLCNLIFEKIVASQKWINHVESYVREPSIGESRLDFLLHEPTPQYYQVKSCFFKYQGALMFPVEKLTELVKKLANWAKKQIVPVPLSPRCIKHAQLLEKQSGAIVFLAQRNDLNNIKINPLEALFKSTLNAKNINKYLVLTHWDLQGNLFLDSIHKLDSV